MVNRTDNEQFSKGVPLGEAFGGGGKGKRGKSFFARFRWPWLWQIIASILFFLVMTGIFSMGTPFAVDLQQGFRYYLADRASDWTPVLETMIKDGVWLDSYDRQVFNYGPQETSETAVEAVLPTVPVSGKVIRGYGKLNSLVDKKPRVHQGIDIAASLGTPVRAALPGKVVALEVKQDLGRVVVLEHPDGLKTLYANLSEILVSQGDSLEQGEVFAKVGRSGEAGEPHLHLEVFRNQEYLDPETFFSSPDIV